MKALNDRGLFKRDGSPYWWMRYTGRNGRLRRKSTGTTEKKQARAILAKKRTLVAENKHLDVKKELNTSLFELCKQYWETRGQHKRMKGLKSMIESWKTGLGNLVVRELSTAKIEKFLNDRMTPANEAATTEKKRRKFSAAARNRHVTMMKAVFNWGVQEGLISENPAAPIEKLRETGARTRYLTTDEIESLLAAASESDSQDLHAICLLAMHTGMRRGEIFNLRWLDVDLKKAVLIVQEAKSGKKRSIDLNEKISAVLRDLPSRFANGYVFPSPVETEDGKQVPLTDINHTFRRAAEKAGLTNVRFHDLRHCSGTRIIPSTDGQRGPLLGNRAIADPSMAA